MYVAWRQKVCSSGLQPIFSGCCKRHDRCHLCQNTAPGRDAELGEYDAGSADHQWNELKGPEEALKLVVSQPSAESTIVYANASCALALTYQAQGDTTEALAVTTTALEFLHSQTASHSECLLGLRQSLRCAKAICKMMQWAIRQPDPVPFAPSFHFFAPQLALPKVLQALDLPSARQKAAQLLMQARDFYAANHNTRFLIETLVLQALAHHAENNVTVAQDTLGEALRLARPANLTRVFIDAGPQLLPLLDAPAAVAIAPTLVSQISAAIEQEQRRKHGPESKPASQPAAVGYLSVLEPQEPVNVQDALLEPLTPANWKSCR